MDTSFNIDAPFSLAFDTDGAEALHLVEGRVPSVTIGELEIDLPADGLRALNCDGVADREQILELAHRLAEWLGAAEDLRSALDDGRPFSVPFRLASVRKPLALEVTHEDGKLTVNIKDRAYCA